MKAGLSSPADVVPLTFQIGAVRVAVHPSHAGRPAQFLLYRANRVSSGVMLIGSGWAHSTQACIERATSAARRASALG